MASLFGAHGVLGRVVPARVERATLALGKPCSIQLSYGTMWNRYVCVLAWVRCDWQVWDGLGER